MAALDAESLCNSLVEDSKAAIATGLPTGWRGVEPAWVFFFFFFILDRGLTQARRGALAQRMIEIGNLSHTGDARPPAGTIAFGSVCGGWRIGWRS